MQSLYTNCCLVQQLKGKPDAADLHAQAFDVVQRARFALRGWEGMPTLNFKQDSGPESHCPVSNQTRERAELINFDVT